MSEWLMWLFVGVYYLAWDIKDWLQWIPICLYVKWVIWRDSQLDRITNWIQLRRNN